MPGVQDGVRYTVDHLHAFARAILERLDVSPDDARTVADALLEANLRGVDTHGVTRMLPIYVRRIQAGVIRAGTRVTVLRERPAVAVLDGHDSLGQVVSRQAMQLAIDKAEKMGSGVVGVRNLSHYGAAATWSMMALAHDQIGFSCCNGPPFVPPAGGREPRLSTNPFSIAVPGGSEGPLIVDMATTAVARGRIALFEKQGLPLPQGWALDREGQPTTDAGEAMRGFLEPMAGYKGYAISLVIDILAGVLPGALFGMHLGGPLAEDMSRPTGSGGLFAAVDVDAFMDPAAFRARMDQALREIRETPRAAGVERILVPGERSTEGMATRRREGIPLPDGVVREFVELGRELGVPFEPATSSRTQSSP